MLSKLRALKIESASAETKMTSLFSFELPTPELGEISENCADTLIEDFSPTSIPNASKYAKLLML